MPATTKEREDFLLTMQREGIDGDTSRKLLRHAATHKRLQEAQCNGDWPCDNGERPTDVCATCGGAWHPATFVKRRGYQAACYSCSWRGEEFRSRANATVQAEQHNDHDGRRTTNVTVLGLCPDCRVETRIKKILAPFNIVPVFQGDPRGATVKLKMPSGRTNDWGQEGLCVPA